MTEPLTCYERWVAAGRDPAAYFDIPAIRLFETVNTSLAEQPTRQNRQTGNNL